ncbi:MAG: STAS domain-containing protein [Candidatus Wallbacteria bacterium]|nr:STAS domain-containing protein [Candidatus Wallbacteria bacterium]
MNIETKILNEVTVIKLIADEITPGDEKTLRQSFDHFAEQGLKKLVLNLENLSYLNSSILGLIIGFSKKIVENGGELIICNPTNFVKRILHITQIEDFIGIYGNESDAVKNCLLYDIPVKLK